MKKQFIYGYIGIMLVLLALILFVDTLSDSLLIVLISIIFVITSIFTYSGRKK